MTLRQAKKIVTRGMGLTAAETPWSDATLDRAVAVWWRWLRRGRAL